jgi:hypothetical protein
MPVLLSLLVPRQLLSSIEKVPADTVAAFDTTEIALAAVAAEAAAEKAVATAVASAVPMRWAGSRRGSNTECSLLGMSASLIIWKRARLLASRMRLVML